MPESSEGQAAPAPAPSSIPPAPASTAVQLTQQIRELLSDVAGVVLAGYLVSKGAITGLQALYFAAVLILPSPVLVRIAKVLGARGTSSGAGVAVALLSASAAWAHTKVYAVGAAGVLGLAACLSGCPIPPPDGCPPRATRCSPSGVPQVCTLGQYWSAPRPETPCPAGSVCCYTRSPYGRALHACVPPSACLPEPPPPEDAGTEGGAL